MTINWGIPLREYLPHSEERVARLRNVIANRQVGILAAGPSIKQLEERISELADVDICWFGFNKFTQEEHILFPIGRHYSLFMASDREYISPIMGDILAYLNREENNIFLSSFWRNTFELVNLDMNWFLNLYHRKLLFFSLDFSNIIPNFEKPLHFAVGNSLQILIQIAMIGGARRIILFGADGGYKPGDKECYYRQDEYWGRRGLNEALNSDTVRFNREMPISIENVYQTYGIPRIDIINCFEHGFYTSFPKISYDEVFRYIKKEVKE